MEKLMLLCWERASVDRAALRRRVLDEVVPALGAAGGSRIEAFVDDESATAPGPVPAGDGELTIRAAFGVWLGRVDDADDLVAALGGLGVRRAVYLVTESTWCDYGGNDRHGPRDWPAGQRSPGITTFTTLRRNPSLDDRTFRELWHGHQSPMSEAVQPRWRYLRHTVVHPVTAGAPPLDGIVHETFPAPEVLADVVAFHGGDPENLTVMLDSVTTTFDMATLRSQALSEYLCY